MQGISQYLKAERILPVYNQEMKIGRDTVDIDTYICIYTCVDTHVYIHMYIYIYMHVSAISSYHMLHLTCYRLYTMYNHTLRDALYIGRAGLEAGRSMTSLRGSPRPLSDTAAGYDFRDLCVVESLQPDVHIDVKAAACRRRPYHLKFKTKQRDSGSRPFIKTSWIKKLCQSEACQPMS